MGLEWGIPALIIKLISAFRSGKGTYYNNKRDEIVYLLAENVSNVTFHFSTIENKTDSNLQNSHSIIKMY